MGRWLPEISAALSAKVRKRLVDDLLDTIAEDLVPERPYRREPRAQTLPVDEQTALGNDRDPASIKIRKASQIRLKLVPFGTDLFPFLS